MATKSIENLALADENEWIQAWLDAWNRTPKQVLHGGVKATTSAFRSGEITPAQADAYLRLFLGNYVVALANHHVERYFGVWGGSMGRRTHKRRAIHV